MNKGADHIYGGRARCDYSSSVLFAVLILLCLCLTSGIAVAADDPTYEYRPDRSLVGNCDITPVDPVPDPGCPSGTHPPSGHFKTPKGVAIDPYGNEYVAVFGKITTGTDFIGGTQGRIDIFDDEGNFISELPDPHGPESLAVDKNGTLYVTEKLESFETEIVRYDPTVYEPEAGNIQYDPNDRVVLATLGTSGGYGAVAVDPTNDRLFAIIHQDIREYDSAEELDSPDEPNELLHTQTDSELSYTHQIAIDGQRRRIFVNSCEYEIVECGVWVYDADFPYDLEEKIDGSTTPATKFSEEYGYATLSVAVDESTGDFFVADVGPQAHRIFQFGPNFEYLSTIDRSFLETPFTSQIAFSNSHLNPDAVNRRNLFMPIKSRTGLEEVFAFAPVTKAPPDLEDVAVSQISETEGELHATVIANGVDTDYIFTIEESGSGEESIVGEGTVSAESLPTRVAASLTGLDPGTSYRFEINATNEKGEEAAEGFFTTYADAPNIETCPNDGTRFGLSAALPDCRAYELVTPAETNGRPVRGGPFLGDLETVPGHLRASPSGEAVTFLTQGGPLPGTEGAGSMAGDRYRAVRGSAGWSTVEAGPSGSESEIPSPAMTSPDQGYGFWVASGNGSAVEGGSPNASGYLEFPDGHSELVGVGSLGTDPAALGIFLTENATHRVFATVNRFAIGVTAKQLEPEAPPDGIAALYDRTSDGVTHVVSLLPGNVAPTQLANFIGASADGAGVAFSVGGILYLRFHNETTYEIGADGKYAGISEDGRRLFYVKDGDLFAFDAETESWIAFTDTGDAVVVNVSPDGSRAYFVSPTAIGDAGENPLEALPENGQENLYLSEEGHIRFVGKVTKGDVEGEPHVDHGHLHGLGTWTTDALGGSLSAKDPSRVNPSGTTLLFESRANLDGKNPSGARQIFRYDSGKNRLHCLSCIPTGIPTGGGSSLQTIALSSTATPPMGVGAIIANLSPDGQRAVFESKEALVSADSDGVQDIYEWEEEGVGSCTQVDGCVYLISSGNSAAENYLYGVSRSGDDIFFVTDDLLVEGDNDTSSIYDARVGGGFPPPTSRGECAGEACQPAARQPRTVAPASALFDGAGNAKAAPTKKCRRGTRKVRRHGKVRCVRKKQHRHSGKQRNHSGNSKKGAGK